METLGNILRGAFTWVRDWFAGQNKMGRTILICAVTTTLAVVTGGPAFQYAMIAIITNTLFWLEVWEMPRVMRFLYKWGAKIDLILSVASMFGGGLSVAAFFTGFMFGSYFTIFRMILLPTWAASHPEMVEDINRQRAEKQARDAAKWAAKTPPKVTNTPDDDYPVIDGEIVP